MKYRATLVTSRVTRYGLALERIAKYPSADSWECRPLANIAREALGMHPESNHEETLIARALLREVRLVIRQPLAMRRRNDLGNRIDQFLVSTAHTDADSSDQIPDAH